MENETYETNYDRLDEDMDQWAYDCNVLTVEME